MRAFQSYTVKDLTLKNRLVMAPMCMYSSDASGGVFDFHRVHYGTRAVGGVGLIIQEATAVLPQGRISEKDLGIWEDDQIAGLAGLVTVMKEHGAAAGIQIGHAGRKCEVSGSQIQAPSALAFSQDDPVPKAMTRAEVAQAVQAFADAAKRADAAGYDWLEIHGAHGYLIHEFLSPLSNRREDEYGGSPKERLQFLLEIVAAIKKVWPEHKPLTLRLSATDHLAGGITLDDTLRMVEALKGSIDAFHLSSGGLLAADIDTFPGYQVPYAQEVRRQCHVPTLAVGQIRRMEQVEEILGHGRADLVALGRVLLRNPYWPIQHSTPDAHPGCPIPEPYLRGW